MKKFSLSYAFTQSFWGIARTIVMSLATLLVLSSCLLALGSLGLLQFNVNENLSDLSTDGQAVAFLEKDCTQDEIEQVRTLLESYQQEGLLREYRYISSDEALRSESEKMKDYPQLYQSLQTGDNPYRASFVVVAPQKDALPELIQRLKEIALTRTGETGESVTFSPVATITSHQAAAETITRIMNTVRGGALILLAVLLTVSLFVLINTIRLAIFDSRKKLAVMRYLGATHAFLTAPFLMQGLVLGFLSAVLTFFLQWLLYAKLSAFILERYRMITLLPFDSLWYYLLAAFLFVGLFVGLIGGLLSTGRYLREED